MVVFWFVDCGQKSGEAFLFYGLFTAFTDSKITYFLLTKETVIEMW